MRCLLFSALILGVVAAHGVETAVNPLPNPGFEDGPNLWAIEGNAQLVAEAAHGGKLGLRVGAAHYSAGGASVTSARLPVTPGQEITLSFQARTTAACSGAYLWFYDATGKVMSLPKGREDACWPNKTNGEWNAYALRSSVPAGAAAVAVWVHASPGLTGTADYDDFALAGIAPGVTATPPPAPRKPRVAPVIDPSKLPARKQPAVIVIKLDDLKQIRGTVPAPWKRVADFLEARGIKAGFGVICQTLEEATPEYVNWIKTRHDSGQLEFWFHGWTHGPHDVAGTPHNEFAGWNDAGMQALVDRSQKAALAKLGFAFQTFGPTGSGAPGPLMDETALRAMHADPHMHVILYPMPLDDMGRKIAADGKLTILDRVWAVNLESAVGVPNCQQLIQGYAANPDRSYFVLQGHPAMWAGERFDEFVRIIDFLTAQKAVFVTPSECAALQQKASPAVPAPVP